MHKDTHPHTYSHGPSPCICTHTHIHAHIDQPLAYAHMLTHMFTWTCPMHMHTQPHTRLHRPAPCICPHICSHRPALCICTHAHTYAHIDQPRAHANMPTQTSNVVMEMEVSYLFGKVTALIHLSDFFSAQTPKHLFTSWAIERPLAIGPLILLTSSQVAFVCRVVLHSILHRWQAVGLAAGATGRNAWLIKELPWVLNYAKAIFLGQGFC